MAKRRRKTCAGKRGAALVEAALVLPTLAIFLSLTMYEYRSYREKMHVQAATRTNSLFYASHGCVGQSSLEGDIAAGDAPYSLETPGAGNTTSDKVIGKGPPDADAMRAATSRSFNWATSTMTGHATGGGLSRDVHGRSFVFCNERPEDGNPIDMVKWAFGFFRSGLI
jgi:hypothetical protein